MNVKHLMLGAGLLATAFGGVAAPLAHGAADSAKPAWTCAGSDGDVFGTLGAGDGLLMTGVAVGESMTCSFTASGVPLSYLASSLNTWHITWTNADNTAGRQDGGLNQTAPDPTTTTKQGSIPAPKANTLVTATVDASEFQGTGGAESFIGIGPAPV